MRIMRLVVCTAMGAFVCDLVGPFHCGIHELIVRYHGVDQADLEAFFGAHGTRPVVQFSRLCQPTRRGSSQVPPLSGTTLRLAVTAAILPDSAMMRMSHNSATSMP